MIFTRFSECNEKVSEEVERFVESAISLLEVGVGKMTETKENAEFVLNSVVNFSSFVILNMLLNRHTAFDKDNIDDVEEDKKMIIETIAKKIAIAIDSNIESMIAQSNPH